MTYFRSLSAAGFAATAVSFGPGRMGFGLFVPEFKSVFSMSSSTVGIVSSLGFAGFLVGLLASQFFLKKRGPEFPILFGLIAATTGLGVVALAPGVPMLTAGIFLAASSAGFTWTPFNDAVSRKVLSRNRPTALSVISTGTAVGIALAGIIALGMTFLDFSWRICWGVFAGTAAAALATNWIVLRQVDKGVENFSGWSWRNLIRPLAGSIFVVAFVLGITSAVYISFAADRFSEAAIPGRPNGATGPVLFIVYGLFGLAGLLTDRLRNALELIWLLRILLITASASLTFVALIPNSWTGLFVSAALQGINVMMTSAVLAFWSEKLFPSLPSLGFTATIVAMAVGTVIGPAAAGIISSGMGSELMFYATASVPLIAAAGLRSRFVKENPT